MESSALRKTIMSLLEKGIAQSGYRAESKPIALTKETSTNPNSKANSKASIAADQRRRKLRVFFSYTNSRMLAV